MCTSVSLSHKLSMRSEVFHEKAILVGNPIQGTICALCPRPCSRGQDNSRSHNAIAVESMAQFHNEPNELEKHGGPWFWSSIHRPENENSQVMCCRAVCPHDPLTRQHRSPMSMYGKRESSSNCFSITGSGTYQSLHATNRVLQVNDFNTDMKIVQRV